LVSGSYDGTLRLWQLPDGKLLRTWQEKPQAGILTWIEGVTISPDGQTLIAGVSYTMKLWNLHTGTLIRTLDIGSNAPTVFQKRVTTTAVSPNGQVLASGTAQGTLQLWDLHTGGLLRTVSAHQTRIHSLVFSTDGKTLSSGSDDGSIKIWLVEQLLSL